MVITRAPVRISFGGGGTDLAPYYTRFGGFVISAAITRYTYVAAQRPPTPRVRISSADYRMTETFAPGEAPVVQDPLILPKAAVERFMDHGLRRVGVDLFLSSDVPPGTGLGSSSAMSVSLLRTLATYLDRDLGREAAADLACWLEIERLERPIGKQDQYASAYGGLNAIEFTANGTEVVPLGLPRDVVATLKSRLLLFSTGQSRDSADILCEQRENTKAQTVVVETLHEIKGLAREMHRALRTQALDDFGRLLDETWKLKKRLSNKVSSSEIDDWYAAAREAGALGGKITGAGGGGFLLLYVPLMRKAAVRRALVSYGLREMTFDFDFMGAQVMAGAETGKVRRAAIRRLAHPQVALVAAVAARRMVG
ncbi:MAG: GHMP kinase [Anaerolineae bacterium]